MNTKPKTRPYSALGFAAVLILADQLSKWWVTQHMIRPHSADPAAPLDFFAWLVRTPDMLPYVQIPVLPFFNLVMVWNRGVSFGLFHQQTDYGTLALIGLSLVITLWFTIWLFASRSRLQTLALALVIGGALGNVIDRFRFGAVIDFLDFHAFGFHWPAFNVADSCIVVGVFILMIHALFFEKTLHHKSNEDYTNKP